MLELEKILEEIDNRVHFYDNADEPMMYVETVKKIIRKHMNDGWIPVEERLPEEPEENPVFDDKPLELYLVDIGGSYPLRAFWNGKKFTDGWSALDVKAWMPLPESYRPERSDK
jgi:hypothetical protein